MLAIKLDRPLAIFDIEATGLNSKTDRIVELSIVKLLPDGSREVRTFRVNPEMPIPAGATRIHGITDADVAGCPAFDQIAKDVHRLLDGCDLGGYNAIYYDIPMLMEEFLRAKIRFILDGRRIIDAQRIYHKKEPRDLSAAVAFFCNETLDGAHGAEADALATVKVLEAQLLRYPDLPRTAAELDEFCNPREPDWVDRSGRLKWEGGEAIINFGQKKGAAIRALVHDDPKYLRWILKSDFPRDMQEIIRKALEDGVYPAPETGMAPSNLAKSSRAKSS